MFHSNPLNYAHNLSLNGKLVADLIIPEGVKNIPDRAFEGYKSLISVTIPPSDVSVGKDAFKGCKNLVKNKYFR